MATDRSLIHARARELAEAARRHLRHAGCDGGSSSWCGLEDALQNYDAAVRERHNRGGVAALVAEVESLAPTIPDELREEFARERESVIEARRTGERASARQNGPCWCGDALGCTC